MHEEARAWHDRRVGNLPARMLSPHEFYTEMLRSASRFRRPLSLMQEVRLQIEAALVPRLISSRSVPFFVESGAPLSWRLILNYLFREGVIASASTIPTRARNDMPLKKNILLGSRLPARSEHDSERFVYSSGTHDDLEVAFSKAVGEVLERVACAYPAGTRVLSASVARVKRFRAPLIDPTAVALYSEKQRSLFPRLRVQDTDTFEWLRCEEVVSGRRALAPLDYFYWHRSHKARHAPFLFPATTSGMAGGFSRAQALEAALREYIERDAFLSWWLTGESPARISLDHARSARVRALLDEADRCGLAVHIVHLTRDLPIPVVGCVLVRHRGEPLLTVGASAKDTLEDAIVSAYDEALSVMASDGVAEGTAVAFDPSTYAPFTRHDIGLKQRSTLYRGEERLRHAHFFYRGAMVSYDDVAGMYPIQEAGERERAAKIIDILARHGCRVYVHYPAHRALRTLRYHVAAVFIPELLPMYLNETDAPLGHPRLARLLAAAGRTEPYPYPHPFP